MGDTVIVVTNSLNGNEHESLRNGVLVKRVHFPPPPKAPLTSAMLLHFNMQLMERVAEEQLGGRLAKIDIINAHDWLTVPAAFHLSRLLKCPFVTTLHDVVFNKARHRNFNEEDAFVAGIENWACHASIQVVVLSHSVECELLAPYHSDSQRIAVIPGGVGIEPLNETEFPAVSTWRGKLLDVSEDLLLYAGRLDAEKGLFVLLEAATQLLRVRPKGWRLVLAGKGQLRDAIEDKIAKLGLKAHTILLGYLDRADLRIAYAAADVLIVPSDYEPFGLVALERQRVGPPVVVSDVGGLAETIRKTGGGLTFRPGNSEILCDRLNSILADPSLRTDLGKRAQKTTLQYYNWKTISRELAKVYEKAQKLPSPRNSAAPDWKHPDAPIKLSQSTTQTCASGAPENYELRNIIVF